MRSSRRRRRRRRRRTREGGRKGVEEAAAAAAAAAAAGLSAGRRMVEWMARLWGTLTKRKGPGRRPRRWKVRRGVGRRRVVGEATVVIWMSGW